MNQDAMADSSLRMLYQVAIITLADGRQGLFTGPPLVLEPGSVAVATVEFTEPQPLPEDYGLAMVSVDNQQLATDSVDIEDDAFASEYPNIAARIDAIGADDAVTVDEGPSGEVGA
jgi:hypothetical protein